MKRQILSRYISRRAGQDIQMHCDDKRTLHALREEIGRTWKGLQDSDFEDGRLLQKLSADIGGYLECKKSSDR